MVNTIKKNKNNIKKTFKKTKNTIKKTPKKNKNTIKKTLKKTLKKNIINTRKINKNKKTKSINKFKYSKSKKNNINYDKEYILNKLLLDNKLDNNKIFSFDTDLGKVRVNFITYNKTNPIEDNNTTKKNNNMSNKYKIITVSYFLMPNNSDMEKEKKYLKGLNIIINTTKKELKDYKVRIYCDYNAFLKLESNYNNNIVEFYIYNIEKFKYFNENDGIQYHNGYIGTMMRFLPFFNYKYHNVDIVINLDIDNGLGYIVLNLIKNETIKYGFLYKSKLCYSNNPRISKLGYLRRAVVASFISMNKSILSFPNNILNNFFDTHLLKDDLRYMNYLNSIDMVKLFKKGVHKQQYKNIDKFMYGVDEYFINYNLFKWIKNNHININPIIFSINPKSSLGIIKRVFEELLNNTKINNVEKNKLYYKFIAYVNNQISITKYNRKNIIITPSNFITELELFIDYILTVNYTNYIINYSKYNKKKYYYFIQNNRYFINFLKQNKNKFTITLQEYDCIKDNSIIDNTVLRLYSIKNIYLNNSNCDFYTLKQIKDGTNYTYL